MLVFRVLLFFVSVISTSAKLAPRSNTTGQAIPSGFVLNGPASLNTTLTLSMALTSNNLSGLKTALYDVSTPGNRLYGQYLTKEEVESYVAPSAETKSAVEEWLNANGIQANTAPAGDWLNFTISIPKANDLFNANFSVFTEQATGKQVIRTLSYSIPASLEDHVDLVHPTTAFPLRAIGEPVIVTANTTSVPTSDADVPASCASNVTPDCVLALYGIRPTVGPQNASRIGVLGFLDQFAQHADLAAFLERFRPDLQPPPSFDVQSVDGGQNLQGPGLAGEEANLDIQYTVGVAGGVPVTFISVGRPDSQGLFDFIRTLITEPNPPQVISISYGFNERDFPISFATQFCNMHMQLGARGVSVLYASGDFGVGGFFEQPGELCFQFVPTFPSTCEYVTSVGGTRGVNPETAWPFSSGGFSRIFSTPDYQKPAVSSYLGKLGINIDGLFNPGGRAFPDLSAQADNINIFNNSRLVRVAGTSASTPMVASLVAQINALRIQDGKGVLGFLNPKIYNATGLFTDITSGSNPGCFTNGFPATTGWDAVTGLGTPIFSGFEKLP